MELSDEDRNSLAFRYPTDKSLRAFTRSAQYFDVVHLREQMHKLDYILDGISCGIYEINQAKAEGLAEQLASGDYSEWA